MQSPWGQKWERAGKREADALPMISELLQQQGSSCN